MRGKTCRFRKAICFGGLVLFIYGEKIMNYKNTSKWLLVTVVVFVFALVASGCSANKGASVNVEMTNFAFTLDKTSVPAGSVTFHIKNSADGMDHEMVVIKTDLDAKQLPTMSDQSADEEKLESAGEITVKSGETQDFTVTLAAGHYVLLCNLPGHYASGMASNFTVQ
jgi:uncharacterized cupredoxin-like copper-binding protein